jgi:predicted patatin/cPLA2 family phospholipase
MADPDSWPWSADHPVREVLRARRAQQSLPGHRTDGFKVGLAVEGGGLRGVVSAAMLSALEDLGYSQAFDEVYACSSGALNAAFFLNGQTWFPVSIYFDDLTSGEFLDFRRVLRLRGPMDLNYVFEDVFVNRKPLNYAALIGKQPRLHIMVTDVDTLTPLDVSDFTSPEDVRDALRASAWLPVAIRGTASFRGHRAVDGGVLRFHPYRAAVSDGCTHVLSLSTKPIGPSRTALSLTDKLVARYLERIRPGLGAGLTASLEQYLREDRPYLRRTRLEPDDNPAVLDLAPLPGTPEVKRSEVDVGKLLHGARSGYRSVRVALERDDPLVVPRLTAYVPQVPVVAPRGPVDASVTS